MSANRKLQMAASICIVFAASPLRAGDDLAEGRRLLSGVRDNVFSFDDPAFYWFCRYAAAQEHTSLFEGDHTTPAVEWKLLLERPADYRGQLVVIEGLLRKASSFEVANRPGLGRLHQFELSRAGSQAVATVVCTQAADIPLHSRVRCKGFLIKIREYRTTGGVNGVGPLLVAQRLELIEAPSETYVGAGPSDSRYWILAATAFLAVVWLLIRRATRRPFNAASPKVRSGIRETESDADFDWLDQSRG